MSPKRNAPTGRNARVAVKARETVLSDFPKVCPIAVRLKTTRKKSNPSSVQPARPLANDASHDSCDDTTGYDFVSGVIHFYPRLGLIAALSTAVHFGAIKLCAPA